MSYPTYLLVLFSDASQLVPKNEIVGANTIAASLFFAKVFGSGSAARSLNILILLSAFGNLVSSVPCSDLVAGCLEPPFTR